MRLIGTEYAPAEDDNEFEISLQLPPGTSLATTDQAARQMEDFLQRLPEVQYYFTTVSIPGGRGGGFRGGASNVQIQVTTVGKSQRKRTVFDLLNVLRGQAGSIAGASFSGNVTSPLPGGGGGGGISVTLSMPAGYSYALRGSVQVFNQAITALAAALVLSIMLEYMLLVALYESWLLPFVLVVSVLFAAMSCFELP